MKRISNYEQDNPYPYGKGPEAPSASIPSKPEPGDLNRLFVYGIFLNESTRRSYGMSNPRYATVPDYLTVGGGIVQAKKVPDLGLSLTGLLVEIEPSYWSQVDAIEAGYDRRKIQTHSGVEAWMYVQKERNGSATRGN